MTVTMTTIETAYLVPRAVGLIRYTTQAIGHALHGLSHADATTLRDGPDGWTVTEIVCHLRDFAVIFHERTQRILHEDTPTLTPHDHEQMARDQAYNAQDVHAVYAEMLPVFEGLAAFYEGLQDADWARTGIHPEQGSFSLTKSLLQVGLHNANHLEQITRVLAQR